MFLNSSTTEQNKTEFKKPQLGFWFLFFVSLVFVDQLAKFFYEQKISEPFRNIYFAFSIPLPTGLMYLIYASVLIAIVFYLSRSIRNITTTELLAWVLILAGGVSNVAERLWLGYVRDFIYILTGVFNLADFFILLGLAILFFHTKKK